MPTRNGTIARVNLTEAMEMIQPYFQLEQDVKFELYSLKNPNKPQILSLDDLNTITTSNFNKNVPTRIFIHGWQEYGNSLRNIFTDGKFEEEI